jgi:hypothetical protein
MIRLEYRNPMHKLGGEPLYCPPRRYPPPSRRLSRADQNFRLKITLFVLLVVIIAVAVSLIPSNRGPRLPEDTIPEAGHYRPR